MMGMAVAPRIASQILLGFSRILVRSGVSRQVQLNDPALEVMTTVNEMVGGCDEQGNSSKWTMMNGRRKRD